jgi:hypothetical protein
MVDFTCLVLFSPALVRCKVDADLVADGPYLHVFRYIYQSKDTHSVADGSLDHVSRVLPFDSGPGRWWSREGCLLPSSVFIVQELTCPSELSRFSHPRTPHMVAFQYSLPTTDIITGSIKLHTDPAGGPVSCTLQ